MNPVSKTIDEKAVQRAHGTCKVGSGPHTILLVGSCRIVPYLNAFHRLNRDNRFSIHMVNVVNFAFDLKGRQENPEETAARYENHPELLKVLKETKWFIHEHLEHYGMFNTDRKASKNIYQFGVLPECDVMIPNFHDLFVLFRDQLRYDAELRAQAQRDMEFYHRLSDDVQDRMKDRGLREIAKFLGICEMTNLPEMGQVFAEKWRQTRYFWTTNHITNNFVMLALRLMNEKFLHMDINGMTWEDIVGEDIYRNPHTHITQYDVDNFVLSWDEKLVDVAPFPVP